MRDRDLALEVRQAAKHSPQKVVAARFGVSQGYVSKIVNGKPKWTRPRLGAARTINATLISLACTGAA